MGPPMPPVSPPSQSWDTFEPFGQSPPDLAKELKSHWHEAPTGLLKIGDSLKKKEKRYKYTEWGKNSSLTQLLLYTRESCYKNPCHKERPKHESLFMRYQRIQPQQQNPNGPRYPRCLCSRPCTHAHCLACDHAVGTLSLWERSPEKR